MVTSNLLEQLRLLNYSPPTAHTYVLINVIHTACGLGEDLRAFRVHSSSVPSISLLLPFICSVMFYSYLFFIPLVHAESTSKPIEQF